MRYPTNEHLETRARELDEGLKKLMPNNGVGLAIIVTAQDALSCGCCYETEGACGLKIDRENIEGNQLRSCVIGALVRLAFSLRELYGPDWPVADALHEALQSALATLARHEGKDQG